MINLLDDHSRYLLGCTAFERVDGEVEHTRLEHQGRVRRGDAGAVDVGLLADAICDDTVLVSVMLANNETGAISAIADVAEAVRGRAAVHTDAVQGFVSLDVRVDQLGVDPEALLAEVKAFAEQDVVPAMQAIDPATGITWEEIAGFPGLEQTITDVFVRLSRLDGSEVSQVVRPTQPQAVLRGERPVRFRRDPERQFGRDAAGRH